MSPDKMFINGSWVEAKSFRRFYVVNPATGTLLSEIPAAGVEDVDEAIEAAAEAQKTWRQSTASFRSETLKRAVEDLKTRRRALADALIHESGAPEKRAQILLDGVIAACAGVVDFFENRSGSIRKNLDRPFLGCFQQPAGVATVLASWQAPVYYPVLQIICALASGNTVVLNPPETVTLFSLAVAEALQKAELPEGTLNVVTGNAESVKRVLTEDPRVGVVMASGCRKFAEGIAESALRQRKICDVDGNGKNSLIVLDPAGVPDAVRAAVSSSLMHCGNLGMPFERLIVPASAAEEFISRLCEEAKRLRVGDPRRPETHIGPMKSRDRIRKVHTFVNDAVAKGARLYAGGSFYDCFYKSTVLGEILPEMALYSRELSAPVAAVLTFRNDAEARQLANDRGNGKVAYLLAEDERRALEVAQRLKAEFVRIFNVGEEAGGVFESRQNEFEAFFSSRIEKIARHTRKKQTVVSRAGAWPVLP